MKIMRAKFKFLSMDRAGVHGWGEVQFPSDEEMILYLTRRGAEADYLCSGTRGIDGVYRGVWVSEVVPESGRVEWAELHDGRWVGQWCEDGTEFLFGIEF